MWCPIRQQALQTREFDAAFFAALRARPDVAFVVPGTLRSASSVRVLRPGRPDLPLDLLPTAPDDPLLLENGAPVPGEAQAVLTQLAAERLGVAVGQTVTLVAGRTLRGRNETVRLDLTVTGILEPRADPLQRIYVTLSLAEDIELWRERRKIPARGWEGTVPMPYASYDGVLLATLGPLPESEQLRLQAGTGFGPPERLDTQALAAFPRAGEPAAGLALYRLRPVAGAVQQDSLVTLANRTRPFAGTAIATVGGLQATLLAPAAAQRELPVAAYSLAEDQAARLGLPPVPWGRSPATDSYDTLSG
jgi:putative ABC transport system permease protein